MGSQVNFFLGPSDLRTLASVISSVEDAVFLYWLSDTPRPVEVSEIVPDYGNEQLRVLVARRQDLGAMTFRPREGHSDYRGDIHSNLVFEFDRPFVSTEFIRPGAFIGTTTIGFPAGFQHESKRTG